MTPKEKAKELFEKMYNEIQPNELGKDQESAKQCALIAVDKLIKETGSKFWYDVKKEIEKL
jgi:hypothetical protein